MTNPAITAMARAILVETIRLNPQSRLIADEARARFAATLIADRDSSWTIALYQAGAALRALAACEPSVGMTQAAYGSSYSSRWHEAQSAHWRAMLAELVKECERDG